MKVEDGTYRMGQLKDGSLGLRSQLYHGTGYWVSDDQGVTIEGEADTAAYLDAFRLMDLQDGEIVGVWTDDEITYVDRSYHFMRIDVAIDFGNIYNQKAIWDCMKMEEIRL
jgi:hypothetical protein